ncbi:MAG: fliE [Bacillota bacterium]|jgi:flagellar hook-basal body complex protein FliE|nr:fliE [Bacillota bacterium]
MSQSINGLNQLSKLNINKIESKIENTDNLSFKSIFENAVNDYVQAENKVDEDIYKLTTGESDDLHNLMINTQKSELSLDLLLQLRNKAIDAYNEVLRINV